MAESIQRYLARPRALFTDVDGTLTTNGELRSSTYAALCEVAAAGIPVVVVTGRPAGWGEAMARLWPVAAVVAENGGVAMWPQQQRLVRWYGVPTDDLYGLRERMQRAVERVRAAVPAAMLSADCRYREVDLAIDWNEEASLTLADAERIVGLLRADGFMAVRSSVHVNFGPLGVNKLVACEQVVAEVLGGDPQQLADYLYIGDALNDAPLFAGFPHSVGVANIRDVWDELAHRPAYLTAGAEGAGFEELVRWLLGDRPTK